MYRVYKQGDRFDLLMHISDEIKSIKGSMICDTNYIKIDTVGGCTIWAKRLINNRIEV